MHKDSSYKAILKLAIPVSVGQVGHIITNMADTVMLGNYDSNHLAGATFGLNVFIPFLVFCMGITMGLTPIVSERLARNEKSEVTKFFYNSGLFYYLMLIVFLMLIFVAIPHLNRLGQPDIVTHIGTQYLKVVAYSLIPLMIFQHLRQFIEGLGDTKGAMYMSLGGNLLNVFLNYVFIFGNYGFDEMGAVGAGYATLISRVVMCVALFIYVLYKSDNRKLLKPINKIVGFEYITESVKVSMPIGVQFLMEVGAFAAMSIVVGTMGAKYLGAHQVAISLAAFTYIIVSGFGSAGTILVSRFIGLKDSEAVNLVIKKSLTLTISFMACAAFVFVALRSWLPTLFVNDPEIIKIVTTLLLYTALFQLSDGVQATIIGLLRGFQDVVIPTTIAVFAYWLVTLPMGYVLGVTYNYGITGCWLAFVVGLFLSSVLLFFRMKTLKKKFDYKQSV